MRLLGTALFAFWEDVMAKVIVEMEIPERINDQAFADLLTNVGYDLENDAFALSEEKVLGRALQLSEFKWIDD
jgi:hypothetical protein